ncbi:Uu.00g079470.m01.CDS01 [Anthostomella pinea]|uniref:Uu.00g079470.m01.CDS01 n=1 Tax=Anthostomella pinea TaxID=933095 RepID=A0AAI8VLR9_9PEZI|nr:Uu.00g079470.m01.CDS01 [Anthostomella pinea]
MDGLFALGSNGSGQLGLGHKEDVSVPKQIQFDGEPPRDAITQVAAGGNHTILLTASGRAYWSGDASSGACGIVDTSSEAGLSVFREVALSLTGPPGRIVHVACTWDASLFVVEDEHGRATRIYTCGPADVGAVNPARGEPTLIQNEYTPAGTQVKDIAAGFRHVVVILNNGDVYGWGNGRKGQLGPKKQMDDMANPKGVVEHRRMLDGIGFKVAKAICCQYTTCLIAEPGDGRIAVLGADKWGLKSTAPAEVPNWMTMSACWGSIYALQRNGILVAWGRDDHGQMPPPGLPPITHLVAGSEHVLALTEGGDVLTWGWGEHGNCGPQSEEKSGDVKGRWNVLASLKHLSEGSSITAIGAGCATSWINIAADGMFL